MNLLWDERSWGWRWSFGVMLFLAMGVSSFLNSALAVLAPFIIDDLDIRVVNKTTGEFLRQLTLNPNIGHQPRFKTKKPPNPGVRGFPMS